MSLCDDHSERQIPHDYTRCPIKEDLDDLKGQVAALRGSVDNLLIVFNGAKGVIVTLKWLIGIAGGVAALWASSHIDKP